MNVDESPSPVFTISRREPGSKDIYILPKFLTKYVGPDDETDDETNSLGEIDLVLIVNNLASQEIIGYKTKICVETLTDLAVDEDEVLAEVRKALLEQDDYYFEILSTDKAYVPISENIVFWKNQEKKLGAARLRKISISEALKVLATETLSLSVLCSSQDKRSNSESQLADAEKQLKLQESALRNLIIEKNMMEDYMYRAFHKCLNTKKDRIKELQIKLDSKPRASQVNIQRVITPKKISNFALDSSDSDYENNRGSENTDDTSSDYNADTDTEVHKDDNPKPYADKVTGNSKPGDLKIKSNESSLNNSQEFPEFPATRKLRSTANQLKFNSKVVAQKRNVYDLDEDGEIEEIPLESKSVPSPRKQTKTVEDKDLEVIYDCDNLMDQI